MKAPQTRPMRCRCGTCQGRPERLNPEMHDVFPFREGDVKMLFERSSLGLVFLHRVEQTATPDGAMDRGMDAARAHFGPSEWGNKRK